MLLIGLFGFATKLLLNISAIIWSGIHFDNSWVDVSKLSMAINSPNFRPVDSPLQLEPGCWLSVVSSSYVVDKHQ